MLFRCDLCAGYIFALYFYEISMIFKKIHFFHFRRFFDDFLAFLEAQSGEAFGG